MDLLRVVDFFFQEDIFHEIRDGIDELISQDQFDCHRKF